MNTTTIELACLGLAFGNETAAFNRQRTIYRRPACSAGNLPAFLPRTDKAAVNRQRATDKTWGQLLREEGFLRS